MLVLLKFEIHKATRRQILFGNKIVNKILKLRQKTPNEMLSYGPGLD